MCVRRKYAAIVFLLLNRFETNKRKLNYVTFDDFYHCSFAMMQYWSCAPPTAPTSFTSNTTAGGGGVNSKHSADDTGIDRDFLLQLRDVKYLLEREKEHKR